MYAVAGLVGQEMSLVSCAVSLLLHGFCITTLSDWLKISRHFVIQSEVKLRRPHSFSRASYRPRVFVSSFGSLYYYLVVVLQHSFENRSR